MFAKDNAELCTGGLVFDGRVINLRDVQCGVESYILSAFHMGLWTAHRNDEVDYVAALDAVPAEQVPEWHGRYCVSPEVICFGKALLPARFWYDTSKALDYWDTSVRF